MNTEPHNTTHTPLDEFEGPMPSDAEIRAFRKSLREARRDGAGASDSLAGGGLSFLVHMVVFVLVLSVPDHQTLWVLSTYSAYPQYRVEVVVEPPQAEPQAPAQVPKEAPPRVTEAPAQPPPVMAPPTVAKAKDTRRKVIRKRPRKAPKAQRVVRSKPAAREVAAITSPHAAEPARAQDGEAASAVAPVDENTPVASPQGNVAAAAGAPTESDVDLDALFAGYMKSVHRTVRRGNKYPRAAARAGLTGRVELAIIIDGAGAILEWRVHKSSGTAILDRAALDAIKRLGRLPTPPQPLNWKRRTVYVPFVYKLI